MIITTTNDGPLITESTYWGSETERAGKLYCSCNAGAIRVLIPRTMRDIVNDVRDCEYVICSRGPWPDEGLADAVGLLFEDHSDSPYSLHLPPAAFDAMPATGWTLSLWILKKGKPARALDRPCRWRRVARLPDLSAW